MFTDQGIQRPPRRHRVTEKKDKENFVVDRIPEAELPALDGTLNAVGMRFALVVSRFNAFITERLLSSAVDGLLRSGADKRNLDLVQSRLVVLRLILQRMNLNQ